MDTNVPRITSNVQRTYHGKVLVIIEHGFQHGFVFEPGAVVLNYIAADGSHPRDPRQMTMTIAGIGRMAAVHELVGGAQHGGEQESMLQLPKGQDQVEAQQAEADEQ